MQLASAGQGQGEEAIRLQETLKQIDQKTTCKLHVMI